MDADIVPVDHVQKFAAIISAISRDFSTLEPENATYVDVLDGAGRESDELRTQITELESRVEEIELDAAVADEGLRKSESERRWLRSQLAAAQRYDVLTAPAEQPPPANLAELLDRLLDTSGDGRHPLLDHVVFTGGGRDSTEDLMGYDTLGRIAGKAWDVLLLLGDCAEVKAAGEAANLHAYISSPPRRVAAWFLSADLLLRSPMR